MTDRAVGHIRRRKYRDKKTGRLKTCSTFSVVYDVQSADGGREQKWKGGFKTKGDARHWYENVKHEHRSGVVADDKITLGAYLDRWYEERVERSKRQGKPSASTIRCDKFRITRLKETLGSMRLSNLRPQHIKDAIAAWHGSELQRRRHVKGTISAHTVRHAFDCLRTALRKAVREGVLASNPIDRLDAEDRPSFEVKEMKTLGVDDASKLIDALQGETIGPAIIVALFTGLRRGEFLGLQWGDVNLKDATITVRRSLTREDGATRTKGTKTVGSASIVYLDDIALACLRSHRREQRERLWGRGIRVDDSTPVFDNGAGEPWIPNTFGTHWSRTIERLGFGHYRLHDLRHTFATMLHQQGLDIYTIQKMLRHSSVSTTARVYTHFSDQRGREAVAKLGDAIRSVGSLAVR